MLSILIEMYSKVFKKYSNTFAKYLYFHSNTFIKNVFVFVFCIREIAKYKIAPCSTGTKVIIQTMEVNMKDVY